MYHWFGTVTNTKGDSLAGWQIECVQLADGSTVVPIYADENLTPILSVSGVADRAVSDANGNYDFFVQEGTYSLRFYNAQGVFQRLQRYMPMYGNAPEAAIEAMEGAQAAQEAAEVAQTAAEDAASVAQSSAGATIYASWTDLAAATGMTAGDAAVVFEDAGTHTDPVTSETADNAGIYIYRASPAGWEHVAGTEALKASESATLAAAWAEGTLPGGAGTKSAKEHAEDALGYAEALSFDILTPRFLYGKDVLFGRSSVDYGLGDAITQDGYHYAKYAIRVTGSPSAWSRNEADGFWEINPGEFQFDGLSFTSGDSIESDFQWYYNGQKVKRALTSPNADGSRAASLIEVEDGTVYIPKLSGSGSSVIADGIIEPIHELVPVGDSLTAAGYADAVGTALGLPLATPSSVSNTDIGYSAGGGIGSQVAAQIAARFGAYGLTCTVTGNTLTSGANILTAINVALLSRASDVAGSNRFLRATIRTLAGRAVKGVLRCIQQAGGEITYSGQAYRYTFTPDAGETLGDVPATAYLHIEDEGRRSRIPLIWIGNNDIGSVGFDAEVKNRIAQMVAAYRPLTKKFVILSVINSTSYPSGSAGSNAVKSLNADLAALYPDNFCDVRSAYNAGTADDTPNPSYTLDGLHYNSTGGALLSGIVTAFIQSKGWL